MCRADDCSGPVIQLSPKLMDGPYKNRQMAAILYEGDQCSLCNIFIKIEDLTLEKKGLKNTFFILF